MAHPATDCAKQSQPNRLERHEALCWEGVMIVLWILRNKAKSSCQADGEHSASCAEGRIRH